MNNIQAAITSQNIVDTNVDDDMHWLLRNWARWVGWGDDGAPSTPETCASAERNYQIPVWVQDEPHPVPPDDKAGQLIENAIAQLPIDQRRVLRIHFWKLPDWWMKLLSIENNDEFFDMARADARRARMMEWPTEKYLTMLGASLRGLRAQVEKAKPAKVATA